MDVVNKIYQWNLVGFGLYFIVKNNDRNITFYDGI